MPANPSRRRVRMLLPVSVAILLAIETSAATLAFQPRSTSSPEPVPPVPAVAAAAQVAAAPNPEGSGSTWYRIRIAEPPAAAEPAAVRAAPKPAVTKPAVTKPATVRRAAAKTTVYQGRNHVWIPSLGISRSVASFPCSRSTPPGNRMYRWGCAGANNVYLFGHAYSVMKPLHDAYVRGRLKKGMAVWYADAKGRVSKYVVRYWRVVRPDGDIGWAYAAQSRPSMTLQTCVGANSQYRLVVRLTRA